MNEIINKIIELRNLLNEICFLYFKNNSSVLEKIENGNIAIDKVNKIIDVLNLGFYNPKDALDCIVDILANKSFDNL